MDKETLENIKMHLSLVPQKPGCYQMYNSQNEIIYVGKAKILANRLKSYFTGSHDAKTTQMVSEVHHFQYIITASEKEAFLLEHNFIKQYRPHYNILLMDDKTYPYIALTDEVDPRLIMTRDVKKRFKKGNLYFGPYPNVRACHQIVEILNKVYPFRKCSTIPKRKCLYADMGQCLAPCINKTSPGDYEESIKSVSRFLNGNNEELTKLLTAKMNEASENLEFERAIEYRDILESTKELQEKQVMTFNDKTSRDIFGYYVKNDVICVQILHIRNGQIIDRSGETFDLVGEKEEVLASYIYTFYDLKKALVPKEILIPYLPDASLLEEILETKVIIPIKGKKQKLVEMANKNAKNNLDNLEKIRLLKMQKTKEPLITLAEMLNIKYPKIIELFDNSNIQGVNPVSAMVCYVDGIPSYKDYRKYKIKTVTEADDFHTMQEVLTRRLDRIKKDNLRKPSLIIVDGGALQVTAAKKVLVSKDITDIDLIGLLKDDHHRTDKIVDVNLKEYAIDKHSNLFLLLEAMQDEVHRFAITFFKESYSKSFLSSALDEIEGIGKERKRKLLENFENVDDIKKTTMPYLKSLGFPEKVASNLINKLNENNGQ